MVYLLEHVATARERARWESWLLLAPQVNKPARRAELDVLLVVDVSLGRTRLAWLGAGMTTSSPTATKAELAKLAYLRGLDAHTLDVSMLPAPSTVSLREAELFDGWGVAVDGGRRTTVRR